MAKEGTGQSGPLVSLAGMVDRSQQGRISTFAQVTIAAGSGPTDQLLIGANARRIAAIIWRDNTEPGEDIYITLGPSTVTTGVTTGEEGAIFTLRPLGVLQIDWLFPWSGVIAVGGGSLTTTDDIVVTISEISLP